MNMQLHEFLIMVAAVALGTIITRFLPYILFPASKKPPRYIVYLGKVLPSAVIGLLVVYCLKDVTVTQMPFALPEIISIGAIILLHHFKRNPLLSIGGGTIIYMLLVQFVFTT